MSDDQVVEELISRVPLKRSLNMNISTLSLPATKLILLETDYNYDQDISDIKQSLVELNQLADSVSEIIGVSDQRKQLADIEKSVQEIYTNTSDGVIELQSAENLQRNFRKTSVTVGGVIGGAVIFGTLFGGVGLAIGPIACVVAGVVGLGVGGGAGGVIANDIQGRLTF